VDKFEIVDVHQQCEADFMTDAEIKATKEDALAEALRWMDEGEVPASYWDRFTFHTMADVNGDRD